MAKAKAAAKGAKKVLDAVVDALDMSTPARMKRAAGQGFDTDKVAYRGQHKTFSSPDYNPDTVTSFGEQELGGRRGISVTNDPEFASSFASGERGVVFPVYTKAQNTFDFRNPEHIAMLGDDVPAGVRVGNYHIIESPEFTKKLESAGFDSAFVRENYERPIKAGEELTLNLFRPEQIRSVNAAFDPAKRASADLLAGAAGAGVIGAAIAPEDAEAGPLRVLSHVDELGKPVYKTVIEAWHGSPHKFDKFDINKIGTGEGAQAYGHGLYFADSQDVAKGYKDRLSKDAPMVERKFMEELESTGIDLYAENVDPEQLYSFSKQFVYNKGDIQETLADARRLAKMMESDGQDASGIKNVIRVIERGQKNGMAIPDVQQGALYRTEIDVDPDTLLDWDKPLSEQSEAVRSALINDPLLSDIKWNMNWDGKDFLDAITDKFVKEDSAWQALGKTPNDVQRVQQASSEWLKSRGVSGIRYKDGVSRGKDGGTYNYVMFDDKPISITERGNADPALLAATAGTTAAGIAALDSEDHDPLREIKRRQVSAAVGDFANRRESKRRYYQQHRADLLDAVSKAANFTFDAIDMPLKGYLGLAGVAGGLASGQGLDAALQMGATNATRPPEETTYNLGQAAADETGSPAIGAAVHAGLLMGSPL